ncbi:carboxypeptidase M32 [Shewanella sp. AS16]|uniref:carboxypeptidase M32 n=1 Tax=Shewanella sp. AS16 TaxID=2907625 RepID=UPI001F2A1F7F|nr:carboxypeptidase M32 [Shewanella sp. AS16]MCE9686450.1 carboxypeptidase M32 [Shewanella sp. AS16]
MNDTPDSTANSHPSYDKLARHFQKISHFEHFNALGDWDQATMMPMGGAAARGEAMAELALHLHELKTAPMLAEGLAQASREPLTGEQQANLREMRYHYQQATLVPGDLVQAKTLQGYKCENAWREQRKHNDWHGFKPNLEAVIALTREEAQIRADALGIPPYDALLDKFEPGMTTAKLDANFGQLQLWLPNLIQEVTDKQAGEPGVSLNGKFGVQAQQHLARDLMQLLGFDFNQGRQDISSHPFCGGVPGDIRLTTRFDEADFTSALMGIIHETGHARYEQGLPLAWRGQPAGLARSMGIHESQSLFCEMQLGISPAFLAMLQPKIQRHLHYPMTQDELARLYTRVKPGLIRVDADEVTYPCHILLRFEAEKALIDGSLSVADLPDFWSQQMQRLLGINTDGNYRDGCMQDIHWTLGELGYFPSYTLGAMYAAQFRFAMEQTLGPMDELLAQGRLEALFAWLEDKIWSKGCLLTTDELMLGACGEALDGKYLERHLRQRYL